MQHRTLKMQSMQTRERDGGRYLEGHFAVFDREYQVFSNWVETIAPGAFSRTLANGGDIKALWNHNSDIVLGSTSAGTATYREDDSGLWGSILVNEQDQDAVNAHARVSRGDVDGCSIGFDIVRQEDWWGRRHLPHQDFGGGAVRMLSLYIPGLQRYQHQRPGKSGL